MQPRFPLLLFIALICSLSSVSAQLKLQFSENPPLDGTQYPLLTAKVRATLNGAQFTLTTANVLIREDVLVSAPSSVSSVVNGEQVITWFTRSRNTAGGRATIIAFDKNTATSLVADSAGGIGIDSRTPQVRVFDAKYRQTRDVNFGVVPKDSTKLLNYFCVPVTGKFLPDGNEERIRIDSISTGTPFFSFIWRGGLGAWSIPGRMSSGLDYSFGIQFKPTEDKYYRDVLTIYYEGGAVERIALTGNTFSLPLRTVLNLVSPNNDEVLYPCQNRVVRWTGAVPGNETIVEFSVNGGSSWIEIGRTTDSSLVWYVTDEVADNVLLRVRAQSQNLTETDLHYPTGGTCDKVTFSTDSKILYSAFRNGEILHWNTVSGITEKKYLVRGDQRLNAGDQVYGMGALSNTSFFISYRNNNTSAKSDTIAFYDGSSNIPSFTVATDSNARFASAYIDSSRTSIILRPVMGTQLSLYAAKDGAFIRSVEFPAPITAVSLGAQKAVAALLDGSIQILKLPEWTVEQTLSFQGMPVMDQLILLPDGQRIAVGCHATASTLTDGAFSDGYIIDIATAQIVRTQRKSSTSPVCVSANPTSRYVLFGYVAQPQTPLWDISPNLIYNSIANHSGSLTDLSFSPSGSLLASSSQSQDNLKLRQFVYPEIDYADGHLRIVKQSMSSVTARLESTYAFSERDTVLSLNLCNNGIVPVIFGDVYFENGGHFRILAPPTPDTIKPGACMSIPVRFTPLDTGLLSDVVHVQCCTGVFRLPVQAFSVRRNLGIPDTIDFGDICPNAVLDSTITLIHNADPVPIVLNQSFLSDETNSWFVVDPVKGDTIAAGGTYTVHVRFSPRAIGIQTKTLLVYYGNQRSIYSKVVLRGRGAGSQIKVQPAAVAFIPEDPHRQVVIYNQNDNAITINSLDIKPPGIFSFDAVSTPIVIQAHDSLLLTVHWIDTTKTDATLQTIVAPCSVPINIALRRYSGTALLTIPDVEADPNGNAVIPIQLRISENPLYGDQRFLNAEFSVNPRMFLATGITSWLGEATLTRNEIINDRRIIGFQLKANFPIKDTIVAEVQGIAGLAETDTSQMRFIPTSAFFGRTVRVTTVPGTLSLINLCGNRRLIQSSTLSITAVHPTPIHSQAHLSVYAPGAMNTTAELYTPSGELVQSIELHLPGGDSEQYIDCSQLVEGSYTLIIRSATQTASALLLIAR